MTTIPLTDAQTTTSTSLRRSADGRRPVDPDAARTARIARVAIELRRAIARAVRPTDALLAVAGDLSAAYRAERPPRLTTARLAEAYAAARMPATFAAVAAAMAAGADRLPGFAPRSVVDVGAGTGAATWAARAVWPSLRSLTLVEREAVVATLGRRIAADDGWRWRTADVSSAEGDGAGPLPAGDLVLGTYLLGELAGRDQSALIERMWAQTRGAVVLVEPGSRAGFRRILEARAILIDAGARIAAPCPGQEPCPVAGSRTTWCHFLARLDRSPLQRRAKSAARSWEDEPFAYVVAARSALLADPRPRVVLGRPRRRPGVVELRICDDGRIETLVVSRREGPAYRAATDLTWGDALRVPFRPEG